MKQPKKYKKERSLVSPNATAIKSKIKKNKKNSGQPRVLLFFFSLNKKKDFFFKVKTALDEPQLSPDTWWLPRRRQTERSNKITSKKKKFKKKPFQITSFVHFCGLPIGCCCRCCSLFFFCRWSHSCAKYLLCICVLDFFFFGEIRSSFLIFFFKKKAEDLPSFDFLLYFSSFFFQVDSIGFAPGGVSSRNSVQQTI